MTKTVDELMRLADEYAIHLLDTAKGADNVLETGVARLALRSALEEVVADARRYRWLRECDPTRSDRIATVSWPKMKNGVVTDVDRCLSREALDSAIDAAMQQAPEQEG